MSYPIVIPVRDGFSEQDVWRAALGPFEPLHVVSHKCDALDAPQWLPAGATRAAFFGPTGRVANREPSRRD